LVFEYLLIEGFSEAAVELARETGLPYDVNHELIQERIQIREAVEDGRVEEAVRRVNELDPEVSNSPISERRGGIPKDMNHHAPRLASLMLGHAEENDLTDLI
jgi:hypothetical protein